MTVKSKKAISQNFLGVSRTRISNLSKKILLAQRKLIDGLRAIVPFGTTGMKSKLENAEIIHEKRDDLGNLTARMRRHKASGRIRYVGAYTHAEAAEISKRMEVT